MTLNKDIQGQGRDGRGRGWFCFSSTTIYTTRFHHRKRDGSFGKEEFERGGERACVKIRVKVCGR